MTVLACEALRGDRVLLYDLRGGTLREGHDTYGGVSYVLVLACLLISARQGECEGGGVARCVLGAGGACVLGPGWEGGWRPEDCVRLCSTSCSQ